MQDQSPSRSEDIIDGMGLNYVIEDSVDEDWLNMLSNSLSVISSPRYDGPYPLVPSPKITRFTESYQFDSEKSSPDAKRHKSLYEFTYEYDERSDEYPSTLKTIDLGLMELIPNSPKITPEAKPPITILSKHIISRQIMPNLDRKSLVIFSSLSKHLYTSRCSLIQDLLDKTGFVEKDQLDPTNSVTLKSIIFRAQVELNEISIKYQTVYLMQRLEAINDHQHIELLSTICQMGVEADILLKKLNNTSIYKWLIQANEIIKLFSHSVFVYHLMTDKSDTLVLDGTLRFDEKLILEHKTALKDKKHLLINTNLIKRVPSNLHMLDSIQSIDLRGSGVSTLPKFKSPIKIIFSKHDEIYHKMFKAAHHSIKFLSKAPNKIFEEMSLYELKCRLTLATLGQARKKGKFTSQNEFNDLLLQLQCSRLMGYSFSQIVDCLGQDNLDKLRILNDMLNINKHGVKKYSSKISQIKNILEKLNKIFESRTIVLDDYQATLQQMNHFMQMSQIDMQTFKDPRQLKFTDLYQLSPNLFKIFKPLCEKVKTLDLTGCHLSALPDDLSMFKSLISIKLNGNQFEEIPEQLYTLPNLILIDIQNNTLNKLNINAIPGHLWLNITGNPLKYLPYGWKEILERHFNEHKSTTIQVSHIKSLLNNDVVNPKPKHPRQKTSKANLSDDDSMNAGKLKKQKLR